MNPLKLMLCFVVYIDWATSKGYIY